MSVWCRLVDIVCLRSIYLVMVVHMNFEIVLEIPCLDKMIGW